jgi:hypothetical protein
MFCSVAGSQHFGRGPTIGIKRRCLLETFLKEGSVGRARSGQCFIQVEAAVVDRMRAMRRPGESYSQVILRLVELEASDLK